VRGVALLLLCWLAAGCGPDYEHSAFRCDAMRGCPSGQSCINERCRRGLPREPSLVCGDATCDVTIQQCCVDGDNPPRCIKAGDVCPGVGALCGGVANCQGGDWCCFDDDALACFASCKTYACRSDADCPSEEPNCCLITTALPGRCAGSPCALVY
jgi:hypothetical protein